MFTDKRILITGGTGSWGQTLTKHLLKQSPHEIIIFSRNELNQVVMQRKFNDKRLKFVIGDIRDFECLNSACKNVDYIFHLAALKHVPICEDHPQEAIKTNIQGTTNVINAAINNKVIKVIDVSTDKAVEPLNLYGMTKAVGEKLIIQANNLSDTKFVCIRGGNVMGSNGSVIPLFIDQIKSNSNITITDKRMTRYFLTLDEAILLLFKAAKESFGGETFVMNMPACFILDLINTLKTHYNSNNDIVETGMRPGEKLDEVLISKHESLTSYKFDENYFVILPTINVNNLNNKYKHLEKVTFEEFSSKTFLMNNIEINQMLTNGGFLI